jgi:glutamate synthase domain-containing protein 2
MLDIDVSAQGLFNFYSGVADELRMIARSHGVKHIQDLTVKDLMTTSDDLSQHSDIKHV